MKYNLNEYILIPQAFSYIATYLVIMLQLMGFDNSIIYNNTNFIAI